MREILFRGKTKEGKWLVGSLVHQTMYYGDPVDRYHIIEGGEFDGDYYDSNTVIPETIGQFTGLVDINYNKIFEGDIVEDMSTIFNQGSQVVEWFNESCGFEPFSDSMENCGHCGGLCPEYVKVIGNIHDNPELLEDKK